MKELKMSQEGQIEEMIRKKQYVFYLKGEKLDPQNYQIEFVTILSLKQRDSLDANYEFTGIIKLGTKKDSDYTFNIYNIHGKLQMKDEEIISIAPIINITLK